MRAGNYLQYGTHTVWAAFQLACQQLSGTHRGSRSFTADTDTKSDRIRHARAKPDDILHVPDYRDSNPYQTGLIDELSEQGLTVSACVPSGIFPLLSSYLSQGRPDIIHLHWIHRFFVTDRGVGPILTAVLGFRLVVELLVLRLYGVGLVWTVHNLADHERLAPRTERAIRSLCVRMVHRLVVHCPEAAAETTEAYRLQTWNRTGISVIPHGNYDPFYQRTGTRTKARERLGIPDDATVLLYFGLIRPYKNVTELIETFSRIESSTVLYVVGNPWTSELERAVKTACARDGRIRNRLEYIPDAEVPRYFLAADAIVLPFNGVLTSGSAILAMTFGRAIIAPKAGCIPSLVSDDRGGITYDPNDSAGLEQALITAMADRSQLRTMGRRNRRIADTLSWDRIATETAQIYEDIGG